MQIKRIGNHDLPLPSRGSARAAGLDLRARLEDPVVLASGGRRLIPTGFAVAIPTGLVGLICPRSGLAMHSGVTVLNAPGIIDEDYRGEIGVVLANLSHEAFIVAPGERIAQLVLARTLFTGLEPVEELEPTDRGAGGFGSTGVS